MFQWQWTGFWALREPVLAQVTLGGNKLGVYDYLAFAAIVVVAAGFVVFAVLMLGLPGKVALARKHPEAEAVNLMAWAGFVAVAPWFQALVWAFKPTYVVDVRRFPEEEQAALRADQARLSAKPIEEKTPAPSVPPAPAKGGTEKG